MVKSRSGPRLGNAERRLLSASDKRGGLVRRRTLEGLHSINRSRIRVPNSQKRSVDSPDLAHEMKSVSLLISSYASWRTCCGKLWGNYVTKRGWAESTRRVLSELSDIRSMDVVLPTRSGVEIRARCVSKPTDHQQILSLHVRS